MNDDEMARQAELQKKRLRILTGVGVATAITAICPPAGLLLGLAGFLRSARRVAQNPHDEEAMANMVMGYGGFVDGGSNKGR